MNISVDRINFQYDGLGMTPLESTEFLHKILKSGDVKADSYSRGGIVEELEKEMASILGKESSIFMPTGTLANHLALRNLSESGSRIIVQEESHIYKDSGDCMQSLSGRNLIPLKNEDLNKGTGFSLKQVKDCLCTASAGKVKTGIGVISIESPVRRMHGKIFPRDEMMKIFDFAKNNGIKTHLDGARLFIEAAYCGMTPAKCAENFDTVYVSLYKYFNAPFGAILAGPHKIIDGLYHQRRMFGGGLNEVWPSAVLAFHTLKNFMQRYKEVIEQAGMLKVALNNIDGLKVESINNGTNIFCLILDNKVNANLFRKHLLNRNIILPVPAETFNGFYLKANESILGNSLCSIITNFKETLGKS